MNNILMHYMQPSKFLQLIFVVTIFISLYISSIYSYLLFHSITELFSIMIAFALFVVSWNTREYTSEPNLIFLGIAYLFVGILDLFHTLSYKGMNIFTDYSFYANQLWVGARYMESLSLLGFVVLSRNNLNRQNKHLCNYLNKSNKSKQNNTIPDRELFLLYSLLTLIIMLSIFYWKIFPICFVQVSSDGKGYQTVFKIASGYTVIGILAITAFLMKRWKISIDLQVYKMLMWSVAATIGSEFCFTLYINNYGWSNQVGHYLKIISFYLIYRTIISTGLRDPFQIMFRRLIEKQHQLRKAKEAAEAANQAKSEFLANMSHEIRTPLNSVLGFGALLAMTVSDPKHKGYIQAINLSGKSLLTILNDILDISKMETGKLEIQYTPISIQNMLMEIKSVFAITAEEKNLDLLIDIEKNTDIEKNIHSSSKSLMVNEVSVMLDEARLRQILFNVVGNAVKFTDKGHIILAAELTSFEESTISEESTRSKKSTRSEKSTPSSEDKDKVALLISISDTGIGISDKFLKEMFTPFSQQDGQLTRKYGGTGLGLAVTKRLTEMMGGSITVKSKVGMGSRFDIVFPKVKIINNG